MDNASIHRTYAVENLFATEDVRANFISPYSSELNSPVE